ncbi:putative tRNA pseudouridine synthase Pus10 [Mortierella alpina]|nr:putative tRNA pseudouridine synthase Pus10 [Mortierella alpina]
MKHPTDTPAGNEVKKLKRDIDEITRAGVRHYELYELTSKEIKDTLVANCTVPPTQPDPELTCVACVGVVQHAEDFVDEIVDRFQKEGYVTKTFNMNVTLPTSTLIRNHALQIFWHQKLSTLPEAVVDIKEVFKLLISKPVERGTGLTLDFERKKIQCGDGRHNVVKALTLVSDERFASVGNVPPTAVETKPELESIEMTRESVFVGGRYLKYTRDVSQTPWSVGTTILAELSVSGIVCETVKNAFRANDYKFVTAGREDANVRMLGNGRPFYMELINPRIPSLPHETIKGLETLINAIMPDKVQVRSLASIKPEDTKIIKEGEDTKTKSYSALCWTSNPVDQAMVDAVNAHTNKAFFVEQQTPIRVLQRRAQMIRKKEIHSLKAFALEGHFLVVHLHTEAGTYIKEFVHGDLGRNQPSLASIVGCEADIMELDVLEVDLEFPPPESFQ